jgi:hypothetical protein
MASFHSAIARPPPLHQAQVKASSMAPHLVKPRPPHKPKLAASAAPVAPRRFSSRTRPPFGRPFSHPSKTPLRSIPQPTPPAAPRNSPAGGIGQLTLQIKTRLNWFLEMQSKATFKRVGRYGRLHFCGSPPTLQKYNFLFHGFC